MANEILAAMPLSRNDVSSFANLINETLQAYCTDYSALEREYLIALRTVVGLGFTAALVCESMTLNCEPHLIAFLKYRNYKKQPETMTNFALAIAEIVNRAVYLFGIIRYPQYYNEFIASLRHIAHQMTLTLQEKAEEVQRLMKLILQK